MIETSYGMLLYMSYSDDIMSVLHLTRNRLRMLRHRISLHDLKEEYIADALTRLGCKCIRPRVQLPCIVKDKSGRLFDEYTFVKMFFTPEIAERYHANYRKTLAIAEQNQSINRPLFKHILKKRRAWIVAESYILDSIWSYDKFGLLFDDAKIRRIRKMLAASVPSSDNTLDILTYLRPSPYVKPPVEESESHPTTTEESR